MGGFVQSEVKMGYSNFNVVPVLTFTQGCTDFPVYSANLKAKPDNGYGSRQFSLPMAKMAKIISISIHFSQTHILIFVMKKNCK